MFNTNNIFKLKNLESRSISAQNPSGSKGGALKECRHFIEKIPPGETITLGEVSGRGMIRNIWLTVRHRIPNCLRNYIIRIYWDDNKYPSVEAPIGDFFGAAHGRVVHFKTPYLGISEGRGFWCFFPMPFKKNFKITFTNDMKNEEENSEVRLYYQINYSLGDPISDEDGYFHAHFRRETPPKGKNYKILEVAESQGVYLGSFISALPRTIGTWREGDHRFFIDGDSNATIAGTGWSDWFLSSWGLTVHQGMYSGCNYKVIHPEMKNDYFCNCYRFHVLDPIYFQKSLRVEHTQIGGPVDKNNNFVERSDDWCSTVYWYQEKLNEKFESLPNRDQRVKNIGIQPWEKEAYDNMEKFAKERFVTQRFDLDLSE